MNKHHVLLMCGGGGSEHDISLLSANFLEEQLRALPGIEVTRVELKPDGWLRADGKACHLGMDKILQCGDDAWPVGLARRVTRRTWSPPATTCRVGDANRSR